MKEKVKRKLLDSCYSYRGIVKHDPHSVILNNLEYESIYTFSKFKKYLDELSYTTYIIFKEDSDRLQTMLEREAPLIRSYKGVSPTKNTIEVEIWDGSTVTFNIDSLKHFYDVALNCDRSVNN